MTATPFHATYRVQLTPDFGFDDAGALASYLAELGVSHLYTSPYLQATAGSTHGYDVVDHSHLNEELGGERWHRQMCESLVEHGLGHVLDVVPNHMAVTSANRWWWDVLENGPSSRYAHYFDVDWDPPEAKLRNTVLLPVLGDHYGRVLEGGGIRVERDAGEFVVRYEDHRFPVAPPTMDEVLVRAAAACGSDELESVALALSRLPPSTATDPDSVRERHRDKEVLRSRLADVLEADPATARAVDHALRELHEDLDALDRFLDRQNYRLAYWRTAADDLDYRRFFSINELAAIRMEDEEVFEDTHALVLKLVADGAIDGLRVDHVDGLRDPRTYLERLSRATHGSWTVVEKILEPEERLPAWPVAGTTGYDFLNRVLGLFVAPEAESTLTALYEEMSGERSPWPDVARLARLEVMDGELAADMRRLTQLLVQACESNRRARDFTRREARDVLREVIASFGVYRTYLDEGGRPGRAGDERYVEGAVADARARRPDVDTDLFAFLADVLVGRERTPAATELALRFPQVSSPVMAKGVEDTAFYRYNRFLALNEVGGDPGRFGYSIEEFHAANAEAQRSWPQALLATSTHDTKRSDDVRARLAVLTEMPGEWAARVRTWPARTVWHKGVHGPDANLEYALYQTLVGAWPLTADRLGAFAHKAAREAKVHTSWSAPDEDYERDLDGFVRGLFGNTGFVDDVADFVNGLLTPGRVNALAQTLLKLTSPGVGDLYQGSELWDLSLVDPDNRRPVDYARRRLLLSELDSISAGDAWARAYEGLPKLLVIQRALRLRRSRPDSFGPSGAYEPLVSHGHWHDRVVGFVRGDDVVTIVPRLSLAVGHEWRDTTVELPAGDWRDVFSGAPVRGGANVAVGGLFATFPVALLVRG